MRITIVGGGVIGLSAAIALLADGHGVTILDDAPGGAAASWGNAGYIATEQVAPLASPATIRAACGRRFARGGALTGAIHTDAIRFEGSAQVADLGRLAAALRRAVAAAGFVEFGDAGAGPTLPDYLPAIGRSQRAGNLLYAFGPQHLGLTLAPVTTRIMAAARAVLERAGLGPGYRLPGLPHRTGHGIGLAIHEPAYLVRGDRTPLKPGMCFSNEPRIVVPDRHGVRPEDHFHVTDGGAA